MIDITKQIINYWYSLECLQPKEVPKYKAIPKKYINELVFTVNDTLRMYKNDDIRMYNSDCITDTIVEVITTCNTYTLLTVHLL